MSNEPFTIPVVITDPNFQGLFDNMKESLVRFDAIILELEKIKFGTGLITGVDLDKEGD